MKSSPIVSIGEPISRVDGAAKVTGSATYSAEGRSPGLLYASLVTSTIDKSGMQKEQTRLQLVAYKVQ